MIEVTEKQKREIEARCTKYEIARILGARALQVAMNAPILIKLGKEDFERINYDPLKIAEIEFYAGVLPITVKRPFPKRVEEKVLKKVIAEVEKKKEEKVKEKPKEKGKEEGKAPETEKMAEEEEVPEKKIIEEVKETEVMELATPPDEAEEEAPAAAAEESE